MNSKYHVVLLGDGSGYDAHGTAVTATITGASTQSGA